MQALGNKKTAISGRNHGTDRGSGWPALGPDQLG